MGCEYSKFRNKVGGRGRQTEFIPAATNQTPTSHLPFPNSHLPSHFASHPPNQSFGVEHTHTHTLGSMFNSVSGTERQTLSIRGTQVTTAASIAVAALQFLHS